MEKHLGEWKNRRFKDPLKVEGKVGSGPLTRQAGSERVRWTNEDSPAVGSRNRISEVEGRGLVEEEFGLGRAASGWGLCIDLRLVEHGPG